jgi:hypothetical protein
MRLEGWPKGETVARGRPSRRLALRAGPQDEVYNLAPTLRVPYLL